MTEEQTVPVPRQLPPKKPRRAALIVNETLAHRAVEGGQPTAQTRRYSRPLETSEQPLTRFFDAPAEWAPLETAWITAAGMLSLFCATGGTVELGLYVEPLPNQIPASHRTAWSPPKVAPFVKPFARVRPGESLRFEPTDLAALRIRRADGEQQVAKCVLYLIPQ